MATEVELPELGESVTEGIITAWLVEVGDEVEVDQPLVEISTDKVDTEIPSPVAGTVQELKAEVDEEIAVGQVIVVIGEGAADDSDDSDDAADADDGAAEDTSTEDAGDGEDVDDPENLDADQSDPAQSDEPISGGADADAGADGDEKSTSDSGGSAASRSISGGSSGDTSGDAALTSPLVRKLLREAGLSADDVRGTGPGGRITREDADRAIAAGGERDTGGSDTEQDQAPAAQTGGGSPARSAPTPPPAAPAAPADRSRPEASPLQIDFGGEREVVQDLTRVRKATAKAMHSALQTTAQLTAAVEVDLTAIMNLRAAVKDDFKAREGASLSPLPLISRAVCMVLPRHPALNSSIDMESGTATFHSYINLGMAVDTEHGLLVPNIKDAQDLTVPGLARRIGEIASRARSKKLQPDDISGGTFTITNTGSRGTLWDTPIFTPPQVAILAACAIEKRPVVVSDSYGDSIAIRHMSYLCLSYDHRMVDGADTARFLQDLKYTLETHDFRGELGF
ncbi:MAG: 2-oxoglutarate dehydrogenase, E2 component, dihydrolipoamide succinyltransferase [Nitriliruptor sp.]